MKVGVFLRIDEEIWQKFKKYCLERHGKFHGALGDEVGRALLSYLEMAHTHVAPQNTGDHENKEQDGYYSENKERANRSIQAGLPAVVEAIAKNYEVGSHISRAVLAKIIGRCCGVFDRRAVDARINALVTYGVLDRYQATGDGVLDRAARHMYTVKSHGLPAGPGGEP